MLNIENLQDLKITGIFQGERVEITKFDLVNKTVNIIKNVYGKNLKITYNSKDAIGSLLKLENFSDITIEKLK